MNTTTTSIARRALALAVVVLGGFAASPVASMAAGPLTLCVYESSADCPANSTPVSGLQTALNVAAAQPSTQADPNVILLGPGLYLTEAATGFTYASSNPLMIQGAGAANTKLRGGDHTDPVLSLGTSDASRTITLTGLSVSVGSLDGTALKLTGGTAERLALLTTQDNEVGATLDGSMLALSSVSGDRGALAVMTQGTGGELDNDTFQEPIGVRAQGPTTIHRNSITAASWGVMAYNAPVYIDDSLVKAGNIGLVVLDGNATPTSINALNDTVIGTSGAATGALVTAVVPGGGDLQMRNSIVSGFPQSFATHTLGSGVATVEAKTDFYDGSASSSGISADPSVASSPGFVDAAQGDYHLACGSPLIDASAADHVIPDSSSTDLDNNARVVVDHNAALPVDVGAYEYQAAGAPCPAPTTPGTGGGTPGTGAGSPGTGGGSPGTGGGTLPAGDPGTNGAPSTPAHGNRPAPPARVRLIPLGRLVTTRNRISLRLSCTGTVPCTGITLTATAAGARHRTVTVGSLTTRLAAGRRATLTLSPNRAGRALLATHGRLAVTLVVTVRDGKRTRTVKTVRTTLHRLP